MRLSLALLLAANAVYSSTYLSFEGHRLRLKRSAFLRCLTSGEKGYQGLLAKDGSSSGYFEASYYKQSAFHAVWSAAEQASKVKVKSYQGKSLLMDKCIDFYESPALDSLVNSLSSQLDSVRLNEDIRDFKVKDSP